MQKISIGPVALTTTLTTNIFNPGTTTGGVNCTAAPFNKLFAELYFLRVVNKTIYPVTVSLWLGASGANAAGTEFLWQGYSVAPNGFVEWYSAVGERMSVDRFLVGGASASTSLSIHGEALIGIGY